MLQSFLFEIADHRREQGRRYALGHILLFSIFGILSGATSYRQLHQFIVNHYLELDQTFALHWKRLPAYTTIRDIIQATSGEALEQAFRKYSASLSQLAAGTPFINCDGKTLRGSFDHFKDQKALQVLSAWLSGANLILAHEEIAEKTNEIPTAQALMAQLGLTDCVFTLDALHCQKNAGGGASHGQCGDCASQRQPEDTISGLSAPGDHHAAG
jgi:hypothetical protein